MSISKNKIEGPSTPLGAGPYEPKQTEKRIYEIWEKSGYFQPEAGRPRADNHNWNKKFSIVIPPPNITGSLHMGHALNATIQDIIIRKKRMEGYKTLWLPGTDHAGIATQNAVEKHLLKTEGKTRHDLGREEFLKRVWQWKEKYGNEILDQLKQLGSSCDWSRTAFTMDENYQKWVKGAFLHYHKKGWIYRAERVINWCPKCQTSLSDLELEYKEEKGKLWYIQYPLKEAFRQARGDCNFVVVATTRPETMLGDTAVAVSPKDARYKDLVGKNIILPLVGREIPVIADRRIEPEFGTGAVKVTPAHSIVDAEIGREHELVSVKVIGTKGRMVFEKYAGFSIKEARERIVKELEEKRLIEKTEDYAHNVAHCYRCGSVVENLPSLQWFLKMSELAKKAVVVVEKGKVKFHPEKWEKIYLDWLKNIKDWCISRQLWWGHQLPVFFCRKKLEEFKTNENSFIVAEEQPQECPFCKECEMEQSSDVLDTWFSSALWPFAAMKEKDLKNYYPTDVLSTARDIINLWVVRMIFSGFEFMKKPPFKDVIIHPTILTKDGKRMSKSLGTGKDPMDYINIYGSDATRFGLIWQTMGGQDMHWSEEHIVAGKKFLNKIWNAARFALLAQNEPSAEVLTKVGYKNLTKPDKEILKKLNGIMKSTNKNIETYHLGRALHDLYNFFWHDFCDIYLEFSKEQMKDKKKIKNTKKILFYVLATSLKLFHPFIPYATEEIWNRLPIKNKKLLIIEKWPLDTARGKSG